MQRKIPRLIDDIRLKRKLKVLSSAIALGAITIWAIVLLVRESNTLRRNGTAHLANVVDGNKWILESNSESVVDMESHLTSFSARIGEIPVAPRCVSRNAILFLAATRKREYQNEAKASVDEYELAVMKYASEVKKLQDNKQNLDKQILKLSDAGRFMSSQQFADASKELSNEISAFRRICNQRFIFRFMYNEGMERLSKAVTKAGSLLSDSTLSDFVKLSARYKEISDGLQKKIGDIAADERVVQSVEAKLRKMPFDAHNLGKMWRDQMSTSTNAVIASSSVALRELDVSLNASTKDMGCVRSVIRQATKDVNVLREKFPECVGDSDFETMSDHEARMNDLQRNLDKVVSTCRNSIDGDSKKVMQEIESLNQKAEKMLAGETCDEREWIMLFDELGALNTSVPTSTLENAKEQLAVIVKGANELKETMVNEAGEIQSQTQSRWNMRMEKLYGSQYGKYVKCMGALKAAKTRLDEKSMSVGEAYDKLNKELMTLSDRGNSISAELREIKSALPKDATTVEGFKSNLDTIGTETERILNSLKDWSGRLAEEIDNAKPSIRLLAKLNGVEKAATVTRGITDEGLVTPVDVGDLDIGDEVVFAAEFTESDGAKYVGEKKHVVKAGTQTVVVDLIPEFTLPPGFNFCGVCGMSLEKHRHVRRCPRCSSDF